ncbi:uncharacterized protein AB9W97_014537 isoform 1-T2 [Spinachia spinachia]
MSSGAEPRSRLLPAGFNHEAAAVVTILLGVFQVMLSVVLFYTDPALPKFFLLPLLLGILIITGGSFTFANERNASRLLLRGCACSHLVGLVGTLLAFCLYCYTLNAFSNTDHCGPSPTMATQPGCPKEWLAVYGTSVTLLLLLYDTGAAVMHSLLTVSALKALKTD